MTIELVECLGKHFTACMQYKAGFTHQNNLIFDECFLFSFAGRIVHSGAATLARSPLEFYALNPFVRLNQVDEVTSYILFVLIVLYI